MAKRLILIAALAAIIAPEMASACSMGPYRTPSFMESKAWAKKTLATATLVADGEVVERQTETTPAKIKVVRWFSGPKVDFFYSKGDSGMCEDEFTITGERGRFVMFGGPEVYHSFSAIWDAPSNRAIDRLLGSDRRKDWPYFNPTSPLKPKRR